MSDHDNEPIGTSGIVEDHNRVPPWLVAVVAGLIVFAFAYISLYA